MIIVFGGRHGSGKSSVARPLAKLLGFKHYSAGDIMRAMAHERGITLLEMIERAKSDARIDRELDERTRILGKEQDNFIIDSLLAFHFIPHAKKVFFEVDMDEAARRIFRDKRKGESFTTEREVRAALERRAQLEAAQYRKLYGLNPYDPSQFDLVVDTTYRTQEQTLRFVHAWALRQMGKTSQVDEGRSDSGVGRRVKK